MRSNRRKAMCALACTAALTLGACGSETVEPVAESEVEAGAPLPVIPVVPLADENFRPAAPEGSDPATGFEFASGVLPFAQYDPLGFDAALFDPQLEITPEEYQAAGLPVPQERTPEIEAIMDGARIATIFFEDQLNFALQIGTMAMSREVYETIWGALPEHRSEVLPSAYAVAKSEGECTAYVDTARGTLFAGVIELTGDLGQAGLCDRAFGVLERLYLAHPAN